MDPSDCVAREAGALAARLPAALAPLARLAYNYWWSWQPDGPPLFCAIDPQTWESCHRNPVRLLRELAPAALERAAADPALVDRARALERDLAADLERPAAAAPPASPARPIAFVCAEYAIHVSLPIYSGGLGVLAGDFLKEASDRALPLAGLGLFYRQGYFHQRLDPSGWQHESWTTCAPEGLPMARVSGADGAPLRVEIPVRGRTVFAQVWQVQVGRVPLYLLDTALADNAPVDRWITSRLYTGDREFRLLQYAVLGVGGLRALRALGVDPAVVHLNEGHAALAALELAREQIERGVPFAQALEAARGRLVFTTHTPVAAGNEGYASDEIGRLLTPLPERLGLDVPGLVDLGRAPGSGAPAVFGMTEFALRASRTANAVSRRHGEVARAMWQHLWPGRPVDSVPITHVTNGVHVGTWMAPALRALLERHLGPDWARNICDPWRWAGIETIPDQELWALRKELRTRLVEQVRARSVADRLARGEPIEYVEGAARTFDPDTLTIGFARRIAAYKRLHLLVRDPGRALALLGGERPIQVVIAGKAHPRDEGAKRLVQTIFALKAQPGAALRVAFLEDYDLALAAELVAGCDVWVNVPRPPLEASGTSGMKAALNGCLNLSVLDGWWVEGYDGTNGWAIRSEPGPDGELQDARDAEALYGLLENEVIPLYYTREEGLPRGWIRRIKASLRSLGPAFAMGRAIHDYTVHVYPPGGVGSGPPPAPGGR